MISINRIRLRLLAAVLLAPMFAAGAQGSPAAGTLVVLVRHAEKASEPAADPPLSAQGAARADALAAAVADMRIQAALVTATTRTRSTAAPAAKNAGINPEEIPTRGGVAVHAAAVADRIRSAHAGKRVLVVGHSNTIPAIIKALGGPAFADLCDAQYASLFVVHIAADGQVSFIRSSYGAPDGAAAGGCVQMGKQAGTRVRTPPAISAPPRDA